MSEVYKKKLTTEEYFALHKLGQFFSGSEIARLVASKINERIAVGIREKSTREPALDANGIQKVDENGEKLYKITPPEFMDLVFTRAELDGFFIGVKESILKPEVKSTDITLIKEVCKSLGMAGRFEKYSDSILDKTEKNVDPLDEEIITDPLD